MAGYPTMTYFRHGFTKNKKKINAWIPITDEICLEKDNYPLF
jgi:hypothetical protein